MIQEDQSQKIQELEAACIELREELEETSKGTLALYTELDEKNQELQRQQQELEKKNAELARTLVNLKNSEAARIKNARKAAIGSIVITYNHEINNPLAIIYTSIDMMLLNEEKMDPELISYLGKIKQASARIREVTEQIKQFENLLPKSYINMEMLDLENTR